MLKLEKIDEIKKLLVQKTELYESNENKRRLEIWGPGFIPDIYSPGQIVPYPAEKRIEKRYQLLWIGTGDNGLSFLDLIYPNSIKIQ